MNILLAVLSGRFTGQCGFAGSVVVRDVISALLGLISIPNVVQQRNPLVFSAGIKS